MNVLTPLAARQVPASSSFHDQSSGSMNFQSRIKFESRDKLPIPFPNWLFSRYQRVIFLITLRDHNSLFVCLWHFTQARLPAVWEQTESRKKWNVTRVRILLQQIRRWWQTSKSKREARWIAYESPADTEASFQVSKRGHLANLETESALVKNNPFVLPNFLARQCHIQNWTFWLAENQGARCSSNWFTKSHFPDFFSARTSRDFSCKPWHRVKSMLFHVWKSKLRNFLRHTSQN